MYFRFKNSLNWNFIFLFTPFYFLKLKNSKSNFNCLHMLTNSEIIKGEYENKLRIFSPIEKRYMIFGKIKLDTDKMTKSDFFESIIPFQNIELKQTSEIMELLDKKDKFKKLFNSFVDTNADNNISFEEYILFCYLISTHLHNFEDYFKNSKFTLEQLNEMLLKVISPKINSIKSENIYFDSRVVKTNKNDFESAINLFTKNAFANKSNITIEDIFELKFKLFLILAYYEFFRIKDEENGYISMESFVKIFASYINIYKNKQILNKIKNREYNLSYDEKISFEEFVSFFWFCQDFHNLKDGAKKKSINRKKLIEIANKAIQKLPDKKMRKELNQKHLNIFFEILDTDSKIIYINLKYILDNGKLSYEELNEILKKRELFNTKNEINGLSKESYELISKVKDFLRSFFLYFLK